MFSGGGDLVENQERKAEGNHKFPEMGAATMASSQNLVAEAKGSLHGTREDLGEERTQASAETAAAVGDLAERRYTGC